MKPSSEYDSFDRAMGKILKADPAEVKAQMEAEKQARQEKRKAKHPSASGLGSDDKD